MPDKTNEAESSDRASYGEIAFLFLRLGALSFGGPAAHIAMMEDEVVRRRRWLSPQEFLDLLAASNLIPGPNSTEMAIHIGYKKGGLLGLLLAGVCFITPAFLIVLFLAWAYKNGQRYAVLPEMLYAIKPVVFAVVFQALWRLGRQALSSKFLVALALSAGIANYLGVGEITLLAVAIVIALVRMRMQQSVNAIVAAMPGAQYPIKVSALPALFLAGLTSIPSALNIFLIFLKIGSVLFGSGYVLLAFLRADLVENLGWLTEGQLLDAIAIGQITPGPVFTTATFVGYQLLGTSGAIAATFGIFLPAFVFVALTAPILPLLRKSTSASSVLNTLNAASFALMGVVSIHLASSAMVDWFTVLMGIGSFVLLVRGLLSSMSLVVIAALVGLGRFFALY